MAKGKSGTRGTRDLSNIANDPLRILSPVVSPTPLLQPRFDYNPVLNDLREWHPEEENRPVVHQSGRPTRLTVSDPVGTRIRNRQTRAVVAFGHRPHDPVSVCVRRSQRKEVMHALRKAGRGGGRKRPPRRTWRSDIKC